MIYRQRTGELTTDAGELLGMGYSGAGVGKNNPSAQAIHDVGPIPRGSWTIGAPVNTVTHGPFVLPLTPFASTDALGRSGFLVHGDSVVNPGSASEGCIVLPRVVREAIWASGDRALTVVAA